MKLIIAIVRPFKVAEIVDKDFADRQVVMVAAPDDSAVTVAERVAQVARTGKSGDGKIFVLSLEAALRIATGETSDGALR